MAQEITKAKARELQTQRAIGRIGHLLDIILSHDNKGVEWTVNELRYWHEILQKLHNPGQ